MLLSVCICTYKRPDWLSRLLRDLAKQETRGQFTFEIVVVDNDTAESARSVVAELAQRLPIHIVYAAEPRRSISHARNLTLAQASGDAIVFIDDDEFPQENWLLNLYESWINSKAAGVLGPVRPSFDESAPEWVKKGGFYDRPGYATGRVMSWEECRTGNVLFGRNIIKGIDPVFLPEFGTGGGDVDFFRRMMAAGHKFIWCQEAVVFEIVPPNRWDRGVMIKRALLRGQNSFRHPRGRLKNLAKAAIAVPTYAIALPFCQLGGHHLFMKCLIKWCNHAGRLLAAFGIYPIQSRAM
jgi:succinoglycan biosynthesis protein ExoM